MADLTAREREEIEQAVAEAMEGGTAAESAAAARPEAVPLPNPIEFFCKNWPTAKRILEFLLRFLPDDVKRVVRKLIEIGDRIHGRICG